VHSLALCARLTPAVQRVARPSPWSATGCGCRRTPGCGAQPPGAPRRRRCRAAHARRRRRRWRRSAGFRARARALRRTSRSAPARRTRACMRVSACVGAPAAARPPRPRFGGAAAAAHGGAARSPAARTHLPAPRPPLWQLRALHSPLGPHHTGLASLRRLRAAGAAPACSAAAAAHGGIARSPIARTTPPAPRPPFWQLRALHSPLGPHHTGLASLRRLRAAGAAPAATRARAHSAPCSRSHPVPSEHSLYTGQHRTGSAVWGERAWGHRTAPLRASVRVRVPPGA